MSPAPVRIALLPRLAAAATPLLLVLASGLVVLAGCSARRPAAGPAGRDGSVDGGRVPDAGRADADLGREGPADGLVHDLQPARDGGAEEPDIDAGASPDLTPDAGEPSPDLGPGDGGADAQPPLDATAAGDALADLAPGDVCPGECCPAARRCLPDGLSLQVCDAQGRWAEPVRCDARFSRRCDPARLACLSECEQRLVDRSNLGCVFWPVALANYGNEGYDGGSAGPRADAGVSLFVSNPHGVEVRLTLTDSLTPGGFALGDSAVVPPRGFVLFALPRVPAGDRPDRHLVDGNLLARAAFRLEATLPVAVVQLNPARLAVASADASLLLPEHTFGTEYFGLTVPHSVKQVDGQTFEHPAGLVLVAVEDGTTVTLVPTASTSALQVPADEPLPAGEAPDLRPLEPGVERRLPLAAYSVLSLETAPVDPGPGAAAAAVCPTDKAPEGIHGRICTKNDDFLRDQGCWVYGRRFCQPAGRDLSGTRIVADRPVALYAQAKNAMVPFYMFGTEHLEEQLPPTASWGTRFVLGRQAPRYRYYGCSRGNGRQDHLSTCPFGSGVSFYRVLAAQDDTRLVLTTPLDEVVVDEAPREYNYERQVDWLTSPLDQYWGDLPVGGQPCAQVLPDRTCRHELTLAAGELLELRDVFNHTLQADQGVLVARLTPAQEYVGIPAWAEPAAYAETLWFKGGDPAASTLVPVDQFRSDYAIHVVGELKYGYLGLVAPAGARIRLDPGTPQEVLLDTADGTWERAGSLMVNGVEVTYVTRRYEIQNLSPRDPPRELPGARVGDLKPGGGFHTLVGVDGVHFGVEVYGYDHYVSYAYPGGLALEPVNQSWLRR